MLFLAHADQPLKEANVHLSAPHIYASALEALELRADSCMSFLNIGSGTGYFSAIVAAIMGPKSTNYGVEIHDEVVQYSQNAISKLKSSLENPSRIPPMYVLHGNALHICPFTGEASRGFDRIYIGASVEHAHLSKLTCLLKVGGILVGPVEDELVKVIRVRKTEGVQPTDDDFSQKVISGVRFAALLSTPVSTVIIPAKVWEPNAHHLYPDSFRNASKALLLCCNAEYEQPPLKKEILNEGVNLAAMLPKVLWMEILSFTHRDCKSPQPSDVVVVLYNRLIYVGH
jgi:protein-L-isoaspartate O-methyltransferase